MATLEVRNQLLRFALSQGEVELEIKRVVIKPKAGKRAAGKRTK